MQTTDRTHRRISERRRRPWAVAPVVLVLLSSALVGSLVTTAAAAFPSKLLPSSGVYFGARVGPRGSESSKEALERVESRIGRKFAIDHQYYQWDADLPTAQQRWDVDNGRIPFVNWNAGKGSGYVRWSAIANGSQDAWIRERADAFKAFASPIYLTFHHEPEDDLSRFGTAADFAAAFRHIVTVFRSRNVTNVAFVWTMMAWSFNPRSGRDASSYYPGDSYIDFVGGDGYNWYPGRPGDKWNSFQAIFDPINAFAIAHHKPWMVVEYGAQEDPAVPGRKAQWLRDALATAQSWPSLKSLMYFDMVKVYRWDTDSSSSSMSAYRTIASDPYAKPGSGGGTNPHPPTPTPRPTPTPTPTPGPGAPTITNNLDFGPAGANIVAGQARPPATAFTQVGVTGGASLRFDTTHRRGTYSAKHVLLPGDNSYYGWTGTRRLWYGHVYLWLSSLPSGDLRLIRGASSGTLRCAIDVMSDGTIRVMDSANHPFIRTLASVRTGQWVRLEWMVDHARGVVQVRLFNSSSSSPTEVATSGSGNSIGYSANEFQYGRSGDQSFAVTFWTDDPALSTSGYPAP
ncbi:MAG: glycosyl hydrolase [Actinomycetota bacterium]